MCTREENNNDTEEYHTAFSECELPPEDWRPEEWSPKDWRTSTRYEQEAEPEYTSTPRRTRRDERATRLPRRTTSRRLDLTSGVAIVPRRIDFDALSEVAEEEDEQMARETLQERNAGRPIHVPRRDIASRTYALGTRRERPRIMEQYPRMTRITPCGKCLQL
ncbi:uncharacterized protein [Linepithema humile]|uniref:uncharacterized protein n=1 Tax=Linepithema humile TaxID=83485 RepID=UPI00351E0759